MGAGVLTGLCLIFSLVSYAIEILLGRGKSELLPRINSLASAAIPRTSAKQTELCFSVHKNMRPRTKIALYAWFNSTCYHPPPPPPGTPRENPARLARGREFPQVVLPGGRGAGQIEITTCAKTYGVTQRRLTTQSVRFAFRVRYHKPTESRAHLPAVPLISCWLSFCLCSAWRKKIYHFKVKRKSLFHLS